jgi:hypothetical protein
MAKLVALVHPHETFRVSARLLVNRCDLFANDPGLAATPYRLNSQVSLSDIQEFISALEGTTVKVTNTNSRGLSQLCEEFRFRDLSAQVLQFRESVDVKEEAIFLSALAERMQQRDREIAGLQAELLRQSRVQALAVEALLGRIANLETELSAFRSAAETETARRFAQLEREIASLRCELSRQSQIHESAERQFRAEAESAGRQANETRKNIVRVRSDVEELHTALREVRELAEKAKELSLMSQSVSEGVRTKAESIEALFGRVARLDAEVAALHSPAKMITAADVKKFTDSTETLLRRLSWLEADVSTLKVASDTNAN